MHNAFICVLTVISAELEKKKTSVFEPNKLNPFCKLVLENESGVSTREDSTTVQKKTPLPQWKQSFTYRFSSHSSHSKEFDSIDKSELDRWITSEKQLKLICKSKKLSYRLSYPTIGFCYLPFPKSVFVGMEVTQTLPLLKKSRNNVGTITINILFKEDRSLVAAELLQLLPDEVLLQIFQYVPWHDFINVACVCQRWANLIRDKQFLYELGENFFQKKMFEDARHVLERAGKLNSIAAAAHLGKFYQNGKGCKKDPEKAFFWYQLAANSANPTAMNDLGWCFEKGIGVAVDEKEAAKWYYQAALRGNPSGENNLGWCYQKGTGVVQNDAEAFRWYSAAASHGNKSGLNNVAFCYFSGIGVEKDYQKAVENYLIAAKLGNMHAQYSLGRMLYKGQGVPEPQKEEALKWLQKAAQRNHRQAQRLITIIKRELEQEEAAQLINNNSNNNNNGQFAAGVPALNHS